MVGRTVLDRLIQVRVLVPQHQVSDERLRSAGDLIEGAGQTVLVRAVAWDKRDIADWGIDLKPQQAASDWHSIRLVAEEAKSAETLEQLDSLRSEIWKILEKQVRAKVQAALILHKAALAERAAQAGDVRSLQVDVQKSSIALVKSIGENDKEEHQAIKRILNQLAFGDMLTAVQQCDGLLKMTDR